MGIFVGMFTMLYFLVALFVCIDLGFGWNSAALILGSLCALSAGSGLKAAIYDSSLKTGLIVSICIIIIGLLIVNSADGIFIKIDDTVINGHEWILYGSLIFLILTPKSLCVSIHAK
jgi:intracellular septation protein A